MKIQLGTALGAGLLVSVAGQVDTKTGAAPVLGQYRVKASRIAGIGKYHAELTMETPPAEFRVEEEAAGPAGEATRSDRSLPTHASIRTKPTFTKCCR